MYARQVRQIAQELLETGTSPSLVSCSHPQGQLIPPPVLTRGPYWLAGASKVEHFLIVDGDFVCGPGCHLYGPLYVTGHCELGRASRATAVWAGRRLVLGPGVQVSGWVWAAGPIELRAGARVEGEIQAQGLIRMGPGATARLVCAPEIRTWPSLASRASLVRGNTVAPVELLPPEATPHAYRLPSGDWPWRHWKPFGPQAWLCPRSLALPVPVVLQGRLFVEGDFRCEAESLLEADLYAGGCVRIGSRSVVRGTITAGQDIHVGAGCIVQETLKASRDILLGPHVEVFRAIGPVEITAGGRIELAEDVLVRGILRAASVVALAATTQPTPLRKNSATAAQGD